MPNSCLARLLGGLLAIALVAAVPPYNASAAEATSLRLTPLVRVVQQASPSVVNIQGQKTITESTTGPGRTKAPRQVNGMGTGVVIDPRGYILTNHHVVAGVRQINVTFADRRKYVAKVVAFDSRTDLAVIKVRCSDPLPAIHIGTSSDLMPAEPVVAVGNAYGYENTVTVGIISALHRDVQVSDTQSYDDLIQTDASINPGNSGGPLLNIDGEMIGVNVAVRAGAQGIGFAIPVDSAMEIAARLMSIEELENKWHGLKVRTSPTEGQLVVEAVSGGSPADKGGFEPGDIITQVGSIVAHRSLDLERGLLGLRNQTAEVEVLRGADMISLQLQPTSSLRRGRIASRNSKTVKATGDTRAWELLGLSLKPEPRSTFSRTKSKYQGGLRIVDVRPKSPAAKQGIVAGDILVGMHRWQTASMKDVDYIIKRQELATMGEVRFYIFRGNETLYTDVNVASRTSPNYHK